MELTCPVCGSEEVYRGQGRRKAFAIWYFAMMPMAFLWTTAALVAVVILWGLFLFLFPLFEAWHCRNCGARLPSNG